MCVLKICDGPIWCLRFSCQSGQGRHHPILYSCLRSRMGTSNSWVFGRQHCGWVAPTEWLPLGARYRRSKLFIFFKCGAPPRAERGAAPSDSEAPPVSRRGAVCAMDGKCGGSVVAPRERTTHGAARPPECNAKGADMDIARTSRALHRCDGWMHTSDAENIEGEGQQNEC